MTTPATPPEAITAADLTASISNAIKARDFPAVVDMLHALVWIDPDRALDIYDMLARVTMPPAGLLRQEGGGT